jgi:Lysozyme like domain
MTWEQVAAVALKSGWSPGDAVIATALTGQESSRYPAIIQQGQPYATTGWGLWQITPGDSAPQFGINDKLLNPLNNGKAAFWKFSEAGGWSPWAADFPDRVRPFEPPAQAAVQAVTRLPPARLAKLVADAEKGVGGDDGGTGQVSDWSPLVRQASGHAGRAAARLTALAVAVRHTRPVFTGPPVTVPAARGLLWAPGQPWPAQESEAP